MNRLHIVPRDDTTQCAEALENVIRQRFGLDCLLYKRSSSVWFLHIPDWTGQDTDFMDNLTEQSDLLAGWHYVGNDVTMNKAEAGSLLEEIKQDPRIHQGNVISNMDGTYSVDVDYWLEPDLALIIDKLFKSRDAWLERKTKEQ